MGGINSRDRSSDVQDKTKLTETADFDFRNDFLNRTASEATNRKSSRILKKEIMTILVEAEQNDKLKNEIWNQRNSQSGCSNRQIPIRRARLHSSSPPDSTDCLSSSYMSSVPSNSSYQSSMLSPSFRSNERDRTSSFRSTCSLGSIGRSSLRSNCSSTNSTDNIYKVEKFRETRVEECALMPLSGRR